MSLNWDITKIKDSETLCWETTEDGESQMSAITETLIWATMFCYMDSITQKNYKDFHRRLIELEIVTGTGLISLRNKQTDEMSSRSPRLKEVEAHIGLSTNGSRKTTREWSSHLKQLVQDEAQRRIKLETYKDEFGELDSDLGQTEREEVLA
tara:strand:+ start:381 stop:836 length:456 start_codon:yes stop_codon:yes gene_type:complete